MAKRMNSIAVSTFVENEDILFEIFLRLTWRLICQLRLVSKQWYSILSDQNFISAWIKTKDFNPWMTIIYDTTLPVSDYIATSSTDICSEFVSGMFSLEFLTSKVHPKKLYILAGSNNGLVLCSTTKHQQAELYVCNPLLKKYVTLPKPVVTSKISVFMGFICASSSSEVGYEVFRIQQFGKAKRTFKIEIYSSDLGSWTAYEVSCDQAVSMPESLRRRNTIMVAVNGVLYWDESKGNRILALDIKNIKIEDTGGGDSGNQRHCRVILLPGEVFKPYSEKCLTEFQGSIACIHSDAYQLSIWVLQEDAGTNNNIWVRCFQYTRPHSYSWDHKFWPLAFHSATQNIVTLKNLPWANLYRVSTRNIKTGVSALDRVSNHPYNDPHCIKAFVLTLLPTPLG